MKRIGVLVHLIGYLVNCPTRWSLLLFIGYLCRSSSWRWWRHIRGCRLLRTSLRAGMRFLAHFFLQNVFFICLYLTKNLITSLFCHFLPPKNAVFSDPPRPGAYFARTEVPPQFWQSNYRYVHWILPQYFLQDLWFKGGAREVLRAKQHFLNYHQCNLETGRQEEAKYFRYVIVWSMICELQVFNYCNSGKSLRLLL